MDTVDGYSRLESAHQSVRAGTMTHVQDDWVAIVRLCLFYHILSHTTHHVSQHSLAL